MPSSDLSRSSDSSEGEDGPSGSSSTFGPKRAYPCQLCDRAFTTSGHLSRHMRMHTGERKHVCPYPGCGATCSRGDNLVQHYRVHCSPGSKKNKTAVRAALVAAKEAARAIESQVQATALSLQRSTGMVAGPSTAISYPMADFDVPPLSPPPPPNTISRHARTAAVMAEHRSRAGFDSGAELLRYLEKADAGLFENLTMTGTGVNTPYVDPSQQRHGPALERILSGMDMADEGQTVERHFPRIAEDLVHHPTWGGASAVQQQQIMPTLQHPQPQNVGGYQAYFNGQIQQQSV